MNSKVHTINENEYISCFMEASPYIVGGGELIMALAHISHGDVLDIDTSANPAVACYVAAPPGSYPRPTIGMVG